jgi:hypothetical protein
MYVPEIDGWYHWTGIYWHRAPGVHMEHLAKETIRALPDEAKSIESDGERAEFFKFCALSQRAVMVRNMVSLAQSDPRIVVAVTDLDKATYLLGVGNGAVDLRNGKLLPPEQGHRITTITPVEYNSKARAPLFEQTVADVFFGDADMIAFFQRLVGYSILAQPSEDVLAIPYGSGAQGTRGIQKRHGSAGRVAGRMLRAWQGSRRVERTPVGKLGAVCQVTGRVAFYIHVEGFGPAHAVARFRGNQDESRARPGRHQGQASG